VLFALYPPPLSILRLKEEGNIVEGKGKWVYLFITEWGSIFLFIDCCTSLVNFMNALKSKVADVSMLGQVCALLQEP
jgi:hypothetical protein